MKSSERLMARLRKDGFNIPPDAKFRRLYPGRWQRSSGHWVWSIDWKYGDIGSCDTVRNCLKADWFGTLENGEIVAERKRIAHIGEGATNEMGFEIRQ